MKNTPVLTVSVKDPKNELFNRQALSITSANKKGKFDILPFHSNFISLIKDFVIVREENQKMITFPLDTGVLKVNNDKVTINGVDYTRNFYIQNVCIHIIVRYPEVRLLVLL